MASDPSTNTFPPPPPRGSFPATQWSMVLRAGEGSETQVQAALASLCRQYWYPLYTFIRRQGRSHHEAEDCTQEFLARLLASDGVARARPERGRFRTFLLASLRNFLVNEWQRERAAKRGGGQPLLPLDFDTAAERFAHEPPDPGLTPEQAFDRNWALSMVERVVAELRLEYEKSGRGVLFAALEPIIWSQPSPESYAATAARLGLAGHAFTMALHRVRRRLGERLRTRVSEIVADEADIDTELRHLSAALSGATGSGSVSAG